MIWVPILLGTFKLIVFGTGMFFAIKWHHDQGRKKKAEEAARKAQVQGQAPAPAEPAPATAE